MHSLCELFQKFANQLPLRCAAAFPQVARLLLPSFVQLSCPRTSSSYNLAGKLLLYPLALLHR